MNIELKSPEIQENLEEHRETLDAEIISTSSAFEIIEELRNVDSDGKGNGILISGDDEISKWEVYRQSLTGGLEDDENYDVSSDEADDLYRLIGDGLHDRVERILEQEYATEVKV